MEKASGEKVAVLLKMICELEKNLSRNDLAEEEYPKVQLLGEEKKGIKSCLVQLRLVLCFDEKDQKDAYALLFYNIKTDMFQIQSEYDEIPVAPYLDDGCSFTEIAAQDAILRWLKKESNSISVEIASFGNTDIMKKLQITKLMPLSVSLEIPELYGSRKFVVPFTPSHGGHVLAHKLN